MNKPIPGGWEGLQRRKLLTLAATVALLAAAALASGAALPMATPSPAARSMEQSLRSSPKATAQSAGMPRCPHRNSRAAPLVASRWVISTLPGREQATVISGNSAGRVSSTSRWTAGSRK